MMHGLIKANANPPQANQEDPINPPVDIVCPAFVSAPLVLASPHSGRVYPTTFVSQSALSALELRASEDAFVDQLFAAGPNLGVPLVSARFPRAYVDVNREPWELDPDMFAGPLPPWVKARSPRVAAGLGSVPRLVADGVEIYQDRLPVAEAEHRISAYHKPYHAALTTVLDRVHHQFGQVILLDCHSMPSRPRASGDHRRIDIVLGDRFGSTCAPPLVQRAERVLRKLGFSVARNTPYAGGYSTERYGKPLENRHALQIEICRSLYLDEGCVRPTSRFGEMRKKLSTFVEHLANFATQTEQF